MHYKCCLKIFAFEKDKLLVLVVEEVKYAIWNHGWDSFDVIRFEFLHLAGGPTGMSKIRTAYISLEVCDLKPKTFDIVRFDLILGSAKHQSIYVLLISGPRVCDVNLTCVILAVILL